MLCSGLTQRYCSEEYARYYKMHESNFVKSDPAIPVIPDSIPVCKNDCMLKHEKSEGFG